MTAKPDELAEMLQEKARLLAARTATLLHTPPGERAFVMAMIEEAASAVTFWADELRKAGAP